MEIKKRLLFRGPVLTASGYGVHARMLLRPILESGKYDVTIVSTGWGVTPVIRNNGDEFIERVRQISLASPSGDYDISIQVTIPQEFQRVARFNIGVTAGIETDRVSMEWLNSINNNVDLVIVPSKHAQETLTNTKYMDQNGQKVELRKPIITLFEGVNNKIFNTEPVASDVVHQDFPSEFNFISVGLGFDKGPGEDRKNLTMLVKWFCEQFKGSDKVGLVLKTSIVGYSSVDFKHIKQRIAGIKNEVGCGEFPRIHLVHGYLTDQQMANLYKNPKIKAYVTTTHGEGYGLPIIEAAACGLPVIATDWSGHLDFLQIDNVRKFVPIPYELKEIPEACVWDQILVRGSRWAWPDEQKFKMMLTKVVLSYSKPKEWADELAKHIANNFTIDRMNEKLTEILKNDGTNINRKLDGKKLSGYTTVLNGQSMEYPYIECIKSMLGFCDEVVVVDGGSKDGTVEKIKELNDPRIKLHIREWDPAQGVIAIDGEQKQFARTLCTGDFLWQQDADEVVHEDDYQKIRDLVDNFPLYTDVVSLPVIEMWAGTEHVRCDRHTWKWRLSRNNPFIMHGINKHARVVKNGKLYAKKGMSDSCEYIDAQTGEFVPHRGHYTIETEVARRTDPEKYGRMCNDDFKKYPSIFHYSLVNIPRKIRNYRDFWSKFWVSMYDEEKPEQQYFKGKDLATVTDDDVFAEAKKIIQQGDPELAFYKHSIDVHGSQFGGNKVPLFKLERGQPAVMAEWLAKCEQDMGAVK